MARHAPAMRVLRVDDLMPRVLRAHLSDQGLVIAVDLPARDHASATVATGRVKGHALATVTEIVAMGRDSVAAGASVVVDVAHEGARYAPSASIM
jgi:hypothetical protein